MASKAQLPELAKVAPAAIIAKTLPFGKNNHYRMKTYGDRPHLQRWDERESAWFSVYVDDSALRAFDKLMGFRWNCAGTIVCADCECTLLNPECVNGSVRCNACVAEALHQELGEGESDTGGRGFFYRWVLPTFAVGLVLVICAIVWGGGR